MSVTKRHCFRLWLKGWTIASLCAEYRKTPEWMESALRKYYGRSR